MRTYLDRQLNKWFYRDRGLVAWLLSPLSLLYIGCIFIRRLAFKFGVLSVYEASVPVLVVGNITLGGVGKTPVVSEFARYLIEKGKIVGIVSRGYGGQSGSWPQIVTAESDPRAVGDEPVMLARQLACHVVVSPKRVDAIRLCEKLGCDIILSDDGLMHYYFKRSWECIIIDSSRGLGNAFCLPVGPLREPASRLKKASVVLMNTEDQCDENSFHIVPVAYINFSDGGVVSLSEFKERKVHAVSAIGNNKRFANTLRQLGCDVLEHPFPDHYPLSNSDLTFADAHPIIMTEKDAVRGCFLDKKNNMWYLKIRAEIHSTVYEQLNNITNKVTSNRKG
jgi:tetraacyldisaccharide 4'-kinase